MRPTVFRSPWILIAAFVLCLLGHNAQAQRRSNPIVEFGSIPVSMSTAKAVTAQQVERAITLAAIGLDGDVETRGPGVLRISMLRDFDTGVTVDIRFTATDYALTYVTSENLYATDAAANLPPHRIPSEADTRAWREKRVLRAPESKFAVEKAGTAIHPDYELQVYRLLASIRRYLKVAEYSPP